MVNMDIRCFMPRKLHSWFFYENFLDYLDVQIYDMYMYFELVG